MNSFSKEIEIERPEPIEVERPEPIVIDRNNLVRIPAKGDPVLRSKQLPKSNKEHYDSVKLPSQEKDYKAWKIARALRMGASDLAKFTSYPQSLPDLFKDRVHGIEQEFSDYAQDAMSDGQEKEARVHKKLAKSLFESGQGTLGKFEFSEVYLSKNRQYFNYDLPSLGSQLDAWGILDGKKTIIEIKATRQESFFAIENALKLSPTFELGNTSSVQELLQEQAPHYFYQIQAQMLTTGLTQAVLHIINRNTFQTITVLIKADMEAYAWIEKTVKQYDSLLEYFKGKKVEEIDQKWNECGLGFDLNYPAPQAKQKAEAGLRKKIVQKVQEIPEIQEDLEEYTHLEKQMKKLGDKLTKNGFKAPDRKLYKKYVIEGVAS